MDEDAYRKGLNQGAYTGGSWDSYRQGVNTREWNEHARSAGAGGGGWSAGNGWSGGAAAGGSTSSGTSDGSGRLLLYLAGLVFIVPALIMGVLAVPVLKPAASALGRYRPFRWGQTMRAAIVGNLWYLGLTVMAFLGLEVYVAYVLGWSVLDGNRFGMLAAWQQWLTATWWSGLKLLEWSQHLGGPAILAEMYDEAQAPPLAASSVLTAVAAVTLHLPGLLAYALVLRRDGAVRDTPGHLVLGLGLAAGLVAITLPLAVWLASAIFAALT